MLKSDMLTRSALRPPVPLAAEDGWCIPKLKDKISIHCLCLSSVLSPLIPSIFTNASTAMTISSLLYLSCMSAAHKSHHERGPPKESPPVLGPPPFLGSSSRCHPSLQ